ncbi:histidine phosphatase family protein, partial [Klebsiella pneumoniae]|nr:histidine phosphatase family protein [Klebsiella pneumoniae]
IENATASPEEIDGAFWMPTDQALERLTYPTDVQVLEEALDLPSTSTIILVRHGKAVSRKEWNSRKRHGKDATRPLERRGRRQAKALADL